jgi:hypothetical protein
MNKEDYPYYSPGLNGLAADLFTSTENLRTFFDAPEPFIIKHRITDPRELDCINFALEQYPTSGLEVTNRSRSGQWGVLFKAIDECLSAG